MISKLVVLVASIPSGVEATPEAVWVKEYSEELRAIREMRSSNSKLTLIAEGISPKLGNWEVDPKTCRKSIIYRAIAAELGWICTEPMPEAWKKVVVDLSSKARSTEALKLCYLAFANDWTKTESGQLTKRFGGVVPAAVQQFHFLQSLDSKFGTLRRLTSIRSELSARPNQTVLMAFAGHDCVSLFVKKGKGGAVLTNEELEVFRWASTLKGPLKKKIGDFLRDSMVTDPRPFKFIDEHLRLYR
jgi:hypothetical protein